MAEATPNENKPNPLNATLEEDVALQEWMLQRKRQKVDALRRDNVAAQEQKRDMEKQLEDVKRDEEDAIAALKKRRGEKQLTKPGPAASQ